MLIKHILRTLILMFQVRDDEIEELERILYETCEMQVPGGVENTYGKVNILLQSYVSRQYLDSFSLVSDQAYVAQVCYIHVYVTRWGREHIRKSEHLVTELCQ